MPKNSLFSLECVQIELVFQAGFVSQKIKQMGHLKSGTFQVRHQGRVPPSRGSSLVIGINTRLFLNSGANG